MNKLEERFWSKVNRGSGCWVWKAGKAGSGYGQFWMKGRQYGAHRVAYELRHGPIQDNLQVLHSCDNPVCVNPDHLFLGTQKDNMIDASNKGRINTVRIRGSKNGNSKLTEDKVIAILRDTRPQVRIAETYRVSCETISSIKNGTRWGHLSE